MNADGVVVDKRLTANGSTVDLHLEGADKVVYFTHDYTSMCPDKNDFLVGTSKLAKKHGVKSLVAVCPVEHDLAYTESVSKSWVEVRQEAEMAALSANKNITILNTDLVYAENPTHMLQYIAQGVHKGSLQRGFLQKDVQFKPVHANDVASAVAHVLANPGHGQHALRGNQEISLAELVNLVEKAQGKIEGSTSAKPFNNLLGFLDEFMTGVTVDANLLNLVLDAKDEYPITVESDFWQASGLSAQHDLQQHFSSH